METRTFRIGPDKGYGQNEVMVVLKKDPCEKHEPRGYEYHGDGDANASVLSTPRQRVRRQYGRVFEHLPKKRMSSIGSCYSRTESFDTAEASEDDLSFPRTKRTIKQKSLLPWRHHQGNYQLLQKSSSLGGRRICSADTEKRIAQLRNAGLVHASLDTPSDLPPLPPPPRITAGNDNQILRYQEKCQKESREPPPSTAVFEGGDESRDPSPPTIIEFESWHLKPPNWRGLNSNNNALLTLLEKDRKRSRQTEISKPLSPLSNDDLDPMFERSGSRASLSKNYPLRQEMVDVADPIFEAGQISSGTSANNSSRSLRQSPPPLMVNDVDPILEANLITGGSRFFEERTGPRQCHGRPFRLSPLKAQTECFDSIFRTHPMTNRSGMPIPKNSSRRRQEPTLASSPSPRDIIIATRPAYQGMRVSELQYPDPETFGWNFLGGCLDRRVEFFNKDFGIDRGIVVLEFHYTTGTVQTTLEHPVWGKSLLVYARGGSNGSPSCVSSKIYRKILIDPLGSNE